MEGRSGKQGTRYFRVVVAIICCLCANSASTFSLYGPAFINDLGYTQAQLNVVSVIAELAIYLPVPLWGYMCDRDRSGSLAALSAFLYGFGYLLAAFTYRSGPPPDSTKGGDGWPFGVMVLAFVGIGGATMCLYLGAIAVCVKAFASAKYRGFVLALPITSFGLSSVWQAQVGVHFLYKQGVEQGEVQLDVFKYFIFLGCLLIAVCVLGTLTFSLTTLEASGQDGKQPVLDEGSAVNETVSPRMAESQRNNAHGTIGAPANLNHNPHQHAISPETEENSSNEDANDYDAEDPRRPLLPSKQDEELEGLVSLQPQNNSSTTFAFLSDRTMHLVAAGFIFLIGPCETYINNVGTIIPALNTVEDSHTRSRLELLAALPESHVSIMALGSTFARLFAGILSDVCTSSDLTQSLRFSRMLILLPFMALLLFGFSILAIPQAVCLHPSLLLMTSALVGVGYGAGFTLVPIIVSVVWGLDNFATNWGIVAMLPVGGVGFWSWVYAAVYSQHAIGNLNEGQCVGYACYGYWAAGCATSIAITLTAWTTAWRIWVKRQTRV